MMLTGLILFVLLISHVFTRGNSNDIYFVDGQGDILLQGPDNPGRGPVIWEWKPHSGQEKQQLTFQKMSGSWWEPRLSEYYQNDLSNWMTWDYGTINLRITNPTFKLAGKFTLFQTQLRTTILKEYNVFGIKVELNAQSPDCTVGSDVTLSCTISKLLDTVCLQWKGRDSSQQDSRKTDQIRVNNTVYLMVKHVTVADEKLYVCEVQEHGSIFRTKAVDFSVSQYLHGKSYTLYRSGTDNSELNLVCQHYTNPFENAAWRWTSHSQNQEKSIAYASSSKPINVNRSHFGNRLVLTTSTFNGVNFNVRIVPVLFEDAGVYKCLLQSYSMANIRLITVKVTAEPSDAETEGDTVTLTCSVSDVTESVRLTWLNNDGKIVEEKALSEWNKEEKSLQLIIQKADRGKWTCVLFRQNIPQVSVPYYLELSGSLNEMYFLHQEGYFLLKGPDNPGIDPIIWEWRSHSGQQTTKQLATFYREGQQWAVKWNDDYNNMPDISQRIHKHYGTLNLLIRNPTFELAGLFTWTQTQPRKKILKQTELFGIKVETDSQRPVMGSDITVSCTISRLSDTVCLHWKQRDLSQKNRTINTDEIRLNNTVYLIVSYVGAENRNLYTWEVQENNSVIVTGNRNIAVDKNLHGKRYTLYRSDTDHNELNLVCHDYSDHHYYPSDTAAWSWKSGLQYQKRNIASASRSQPINVDRTHFGNRLVPMMSTFNGLTFNLRIVPVLFEDAGVYKCSLQSNTMVTVTLITVKVTAEPSDAKTEGGSITLTCSVSNVTESIRLVWINNDGKIVEEKTLNKRNREEKSLKLIIQKSEKSRGKRTCVLFHRNMPQISVPYYLELNGGLNEMYFLHQEGYFLLKGPDNPGNGPIIWEWRSHSGQQTTKQLGTFHREGQQWAVKWSDDYNNMPDISERIHEHFGTLNLLVRNPTFELAGLFTWTQTQPRKKILKQIELFGIKVETDTLRPVMGGDITLSCSISRLSDTVSLHWKQRDPSLQNRRMNTDEIRLNRTVYLIVRHAGVENQNLSTWEVQENNSIILNGNINIDVDLNLHDKIYTLYRSVADHSELELICEVDSVLIKTTWTWSSPLKTQDKEIASSYKSKSVNINSTYFGSRLVRPVTSFTDRFFSMRIVPVQFEDAGVYRCSQGSDNHLTINLVTVKAELSDEETEGDSVTLTCSISHVTESMRLVWINSDGKIVAEKTFKEQKQREDNLQLITQKFDSDRMNWTCILFHQNTPKVLIPYYLKFTNPYTVQPTAAIILGSLAFLIVILVMILTLRRCRRAGRQGLESQRSKPVQRRENREDAFQLYSNINEIQQMQDTESPVLETSSFSEYAIVNRKAKADNMEREDIHYGSINFHKTAIGSKQGTERTQRNKQPSVVELDASNENDSSIYAQITQVRDQ